MKVHVGLDVQLMRVRGWMPPGGGGGGGPSSFSLATGQ